MGDADPRLVPVLPARRIVRSFWLVTHKDTHSLARVRAFKDWLTDLIARESARLLPR
jgi:DNA-binding transcriptional LysR family regulator